MGSGNCFVNLIPALVARVNMVNSNEKLEAKKLAKQTRKFNLAISIILRMVHLQMFENMLLICVY